ncbi:MAG: guanylate kinase [Chitinispirillaceae bacterium]|jgi:guanylate kinase
MPESGVKKGKIFVFSAPSGAGKTTLIDYVRDSVPGITYSVSATTRPPRRGEINGRHYFFMSEEEFMRRIKKEEFAEWALVHGYYYGTPKSFIDATIAAGRHIIMDIDVAGKKKFDRLYPEAVGILVLPPGPDELARRLRDRKSDDEKTIAVRLNNALQEMTFAKAEGKYEYTIINDDLERAKQDAARIVRSLTAG